MATNQNSNKEKTEKKNSSAKKSSSENSETKTARTKKTVAKKPLTENSENADKNTSAKKSAAKVSDTKVSEPVKKTVSRKTVSEKTSSASLKDGEEKVTGTKRQTKKSQSSEESVSKTKKASSKKPLTEVSETATKKTSAKKTSAKVSDTKVSEPVKKTVSRKTVSEKTSSASLKDGEEKVTGTKRQTKKSQPSKTSEIKEDFLPAETKKTIVAKRRPSSLSEKKKDDIEKRILETSVSEEKIRAFEALAGERPSEKKLSEDKTVAFDSEKTKSEEKGEDVSNQIKQSNAEQQLLWSGTYGGAEKKDSFNEDNKFLAFMKKNWKYIAAFLALVIFILILIFGIRGCVSSSGGKDKKANTVSRIERYLDRNAFDSALSLIDDLLEEDGDDPQALQLLDRALELKKAYDLEIARAGGNGSSSRIDVNFDQSGLNDMLNSLAKKQEEAAEREQQRVEQEEAKKAEEEAKKKAQEAAEAKRKADEEKLRAENEKYAKLLDQINEQINKGKVALETGNSSGAISAFEKAKSLLPSGSDPKEKNLAAGKLSEIAQLLYNGSENYDEPAKSNLNDKAVSYARETLIKNPKDGPSHYIIGMNFFGKKNFADAEIELKMAVAEDSKNALYYYQLGRAQGQQKKFADARQSLTSSIKYDGNFSPAYYNLGIVQRNLGQSDAALSSFRSAYTINENYENAYLAAARLLQTSKKDYKGACELFEKAAKVNPSNIQTWQELGSAYSSSANYKESENAYRQALALQNGKKDAETNYNLSVVLQKENKISDALKYASVSYVQRDSAKRIGKAAIIHNYADLLEKTGDQESAIKLYKEALAENPSYVDSLINLGSLCLKNDDVDLALTYLLKAYGQEKNNFKLNNNLGNAYLKKEKYTEAVDFFLAVLKSNEISKEDEDTARENLAKAYSSAKKWDEAGAVYAQIVKNDKTNYNAMIDYAKVLMQKGDFVTAGDYLSIVKEKKPFLRAEEVNQLLEGIESGSSSVYEK